MSDWISVKDEPPRRDIPILVAMEYESMAITAVWMRAYEYSDFGFYDSQGLVRLKDEMITHWMPAPKMPKCE